MRRRLGIANFLPILTAAFAVLPASPLHAADASPWHKDIRSEARLISAGAREQSGVKELRAGVEIQLRPGWKTYWRYPGDSGVPPVFDFSSSDNVKSVTVLWPVPRRFPDGAGGQSIGYAGEVVFPLHVVPQDSRKPVTLRMQLDYGVCETVCIPAKASGELVLTDRPGAMRPLVDAAEARVPKRVTVGEGGAPSIAMVRREAGPGKPKILVDIRVPAGAEPELFAEGPTADWALPLPSAVPGAPDGLQRFAFELDGLPPGAKPDGAILRFTAAAGGRAVETEFRLD